MSRKRIVKEWSLCSFSDLKTSFIELAVRIGFLWTFMPSLRLVSLVSDSWSRDMPKVLQSMMPIKDKFKFTVAELRRDAETMSVVHQDSLNGINVGHRVKWKTYSTKRLERIETWEHHEQQKPWECQEIAIIFLQSAIKGSLTVLGWNALGIKLSFIRQ